MNVDSDVMVIFVPLNTAKHLPVFLELNTSYLDWVIKEIERHYKVDLTKTLGSVHSYVARMLDELELYQPPGGAFYFLEDEGSIIGMCALKKLNPEIGEIKRMYIKPNYRGKGYGKKMIEKLISRSKELGYSSIRLDTGPFMKQAQKVYRSSGFEIIEEYEESEVPKEVREGWIFMEKKI